MDTREQRFSRLTGQSLVASALLAETVASIENLPEPGRTRTETSNESVG
jgi:hypothetical protein